MNTKSTPDLDITLPALRAVVTPRAVHRLARMLGLLFVSLPVILLAAPWQQNVQGSGRVIALAPVDRQQRIEAPIDGRVVHWHVREGASVSSGTPIVEISDNDPEFVARLELQQTAALNRLEAARGRVETNRTQVEALEEARRLAVLAADDRLRMASDRIAAADQGVQAAQAAVKTARLNLERQKILAEKGIASKRTLELAELEGERTRTDLDRAEATLRAARSEESSVEAERDRTDQEALARVEAARAALQGAEGDLAQARGDLARMEVTVARQRTQTVRAPSSGFVVRVDAAQGGEMVKAGETLVVFVPATEDRAAEVWLDGNDAPLVTAGRTVRLQFEGWPAVQFVGWPSVAKGTFGGRVAFVDATDNGQGKFRVVIVPDEAEPWPAARFLRQGVRAKAWVLLERVSLGFELWRQLNGFPPALRAPAAASTSKVK